MAPLTLEPSHKYGYDIDLCFQIFKNIFLNRIHRYHDTSDVTYNSKKILKNHRDFLSV